MSNKKTRVGIIGIQPDRSWAAIAHIPALQALADDYEVTAVSTTRQASADEAAKRYGIPDAYDNYQALVTSPDVDLVVVTVKVPAHLALVTAALNAGKHVYCEWLLGNGLAEAETLAALAKAKGVHGVIGLQARMSPVLAYAKDLIAQGYVGEVLSVSLVGTALSWGAFVEQPNAYNADIKNGVTPLTIPVSHTLDALTAVLGEFKDVSAVLANRRHKTTVIETGEVIDLTAQDQVVVAGTLQDGTVVSLHYRGGMDQGTGLLWEIQGSKGVLRLSAFGGHAQIFDLTLQGATEGEQALAPLTTPEEYYHTSLRSGPPLNVAEVYAALTRDLREGTKLVADFDHAVIRHRLVAAIEKAAATGSRQSL